MAVRAMAMGQVKVALAAWPQHRPWLLPIYCYWQYWHGLSSDLVGPLQRSLWSQPLSWIDQAVEVVLDALESREAGALLACPLMMSSVRGCP